MSLETKLDQLIDLMSRPVQGIEIAADDTPALILAELRTHSALLTTLCQHQDDAAKIHDATVRGFNSRTAKSMPSPSDGMFFRLGGEPIPWPGHSRCEETLSASDQAQLETRKFAISELPNLEPRPVPMPGERSGQIADSESLLAKVASDSSGNRA